MGIFDPIADALSGKAAPQKPAQADSGSLNQTSNGNGQSFARLRAGRDYEMAQHGMGGGDGHTTAGMDQALQSHADKVHPVPKR